MAWSLNFLAVDDFVGRVRLWHLGVHPPPARKVNPGILARYAADGPAHAVAPSVPHGHGDADDVLPGCGDVSGLEGGGGGGRKVRQDVAGRGRDSSSW